MVFYTQVCLSNLQKIRIYTMMFLEHWTSPRSSLFSLFSNDGIANIRIKLANEMLFNPRNIGNKTPVITYDLNQYMRAQDAFAEFGAYATEIFIAFCEECASKDTCLCMSSDSHERDDPSLQNIFLTLFSSSNSNL